jgi:DNA-binding response OmpR family regulator
MSRICLIGESDPFIAQLLRRFSEESGLEPLQARVGQDVLSLARQQQPELVIIEPDLPGKLRGWEAIDAMRKEPGLHATPVITCSWRQAAEAAELVHSADGHLQKPELHYDDFLAMLKSIGIQSDHSISPRSDGNDGTRNNL